MLSAEYGEAAYECADAYYYYGKALLDMARAESGVFGNALDGGRIYFLKEHCRKTSNIDWQTAHKA